MSTDSPYSDWRVWLLRILVWLFGWTRSLWNIFYRLFLTISPSVPVDLRNASGTPPIRELFWYSFAIGLFFCLFVTGFLCYVNDTLTGTDPGRRYFVQDGWNLTLYALVCPTYVGLCSCVIAISVHEWGALAEYANARARSISEAPTRSSRRVYSTFFVIFLLCAMFTSRFIGDTLDLSAVEKTTRVYWFMNSLDNGIRILNRVGYYYLSLNFSLLFLTLLAISCFIALAAEVLRAGTAKNVDDIEDFATLKTRLESFTKVYILAKGLVATFTVNVIVWAYSPLGKTDNVLAAQIALTIIGVFFVAVPRQYIELKWFELWQASGREFEYQETRPWKIKAAASFLDAWFIAAVMGVWGLDLNGMIARLSLFLTRGL